jgi:hypothetical protein
MSNGRRSNLLDTRPQRRGSRRRQMARSGENASRCMSCRLEVLIDFENRHGSRTHNPLAIDVPSAGTDTIARTPQLA